MGIIRRPLFLLERNVSCIPRVVTFDFFHTLYNRLFGTMVEENEERRMNEVRNIFIDPIFRRKDFVGTDRKRRRLGGHVDRPVTTSGLFETCPSLVSHSTRTPLFFSASDCTVR